MSGAGLAFLWLAWVTAGGSPGPATLAIAATAMERGRAQALALAAGVMTGSACWGVAAGLGLGAVMFANVWVAEILRYAAAVYILWLAFKSARRAMTPGNAARAEAAKGTLREAWMKGALLHLTNPKAIFSWGAVYALAVPVEANLSEIAFIWLFLLSGSFIVFGGYALLFSTARATNAYRRLRRWFEGAFAILFGGAALAILSGRH